MPGLAARGRLRPLLRGLLLLLASSAAPALAAPPAAKPQRIVSLNLCTDQLLLQLVERERIQALSILSQSALNTVLHAEAEGLPVATGNAEEVIAMAPDLVLVGSYTTRHTTAMLRRFGIPVLAIPGANSFAEVASELRTVAAAVGEIERGEALIADFEQRARTLEARHHNPRPLATQFVSGGFSAGSHTLYHDIFAAGGHDNGGAQAGLVGYGHLPLEQLIAHAPAVLITSDYRRDQPTLGNRLLQHPAITALGVRELAMPARLTVCGGDWNLDAAATLLAADTQP